MFGLHVLDWLVILGYLGVVLFLGKLGAKSTGSQEGFFLAERKLNSVYQFFLNFGNSTDANGAVSTASLVYQQGVSGVWLAFQMVFMNPYFWFMNLWFRRVRLVTMADLFEDRLNSHRLAQLYAVFQIVISVAITIGFGNLIAYKICAALIVKPEAAWTATERRSVAEHRELHTLELAVKAGALAPTNAPRLAELRERDAHGELHNEITLLRPWVFYLAYTLVVGLYIVTGGMAATALNEIFQASLIVVFSFILIPTGLSAIGGWGALAEKVPAAMFDLIGSGGASRIEGWTLLAIFLASLVQINGIPGNMGISGSAKNEYAARFGAVSGTYAKRFMTIGWAFIGLIAVALFQGTSALSDPDTAWGLMSRQLLGPGLLGVMLAGVLAANMSTVAAQTMCVSALFVRNIWTRVRPGLGDREAVAAGRWTIGAVLVVGIFAALTMDNVFAVMQVLLTVNLPFGAAVWFIFFWRRLTAPAVWTAVLLASAIDVVGPLVMPHVSAVATHPALVVREADQTGKLMPVYFESIVRSRPDDPRSPLVGRTRFHAELWVLAQAGLDVPRLSPGGRFAARFFFDALFPVLLLVVVSLLTRPADPARADQFYGKMKTPIGATPELERAAMEATRREPHRFAATKLLPGSAWEFTKWSRTDAVGFGVCCLVSGGIIALFWLLLRLAAP